MTTIDTTPEAIAALLDGVTPGPWHISPDGYGVTDKLVTFDRDGARQRETPNIVIFAETEGNARFIAAARELVPALAAERDEARAQVAELQDKLRFYGHFTRHPEAALARRDAAMRNEGRRQAAGIARADAQSETGPILRRRLAGNGTPVAAAARRRQAIRTSRRILATLEPEGGE